MPGLVYFMVNILVLHFSYSFCGFWDFLGAPCLEITLTSASVYHRSLGLYHLLLAVSLIRLRAHLVNLVWSHLKINMKGKSEWHFSLSSHSHSFWVIWHFGSVLFNLNALILLCTLVLCRCLSWWTLPPRIECS